MSEQQFKGQVALVNAAAGSGIGAAIVEAQLARAVAEEYIDAYRSRSPLGRPGTPQEVAEVVMFLASAASAHVSGETIRVAC